MSQQPRADVCRTLSLFTVGVFDSLSNEFALQLSCNNITPPNTRSFGSSSQSLHTSTRRIKYTLLRGQNNLVKAVIQLVFDRDSGVLQEYSQYTRQLLLKKKKKQKLWTVNRTDSSWQSLSSPA